MRFRTFTVAVTTAFHCITALDRLMLATKELVGETYYIFGLGAATSHADPRTPAYFNYRPGQEA
jgi:hypothetical protein